MRGKDVRQSESKKPHGITPAYAGKSFFSSYIDVCERDHPRVCGEKRDECYWQIDRAGSPPRMRGKGCVLAHHGMPDRITPAYAGKSVLLIRR